MTNYHKIYNYQKMITHDKITLIIAAAHSIALNNILSLKNKNTVKLSPLIKQSRLSLKLIYYRKFSFSWYVNNLKYIIYKIHIYFYTTIIIFNTNRYLNLFSWKKKNIKELLKFKNRKMKNLKKKKIELWKSSKSQIFFLLHLFPITLSNIHHTASNDVSPPEQLLWICLTESRHQNSTPDKNLEPVDV